jgi:cytochrome c-type biogenesis protein CcmF
MFDRKLSVGPPFFNMAFTPFMVALSVILPLGAVMPWKRADLGRAMQPLWGVLVLALALGGLAWTLQTGRSMLGPVGVLLGAWVVFGALADLSLRTGRADLRGRLGRLTRLPRADWGKATAHIGFGVSVAAIAGLTAWQTEDIRVVRPGESFPVGAYTVTLVEVHDESGPNYRTTKAEMHVARDGRPVAVLHPEKRFYPVAQMPTTEAGIDYSLARDIYLVLGDPQEGGGFAVRSYVKPFVNWIWIGAALMALGGVLSLSDRRYRRAAGAVRAPNAVPAE